MPENSQPSPQKFYQKKPFIFLVTGVLVFGAGFWSGQEYMKYQITSSFATAFSSFGNSSKSTNSTLLDKKAESVRKVQVGFNQFVKIDDFEVALEKVEILTEIKTDYYGVLKPKTEWLVLTFTGENKGKSAQGFSLSSSKLVTSDGTEYKKENRSGLPDQLNSKEVPEGFSTCLECSINPKTKAKSRVYFDVKADLSTDKVVIGNNEFALK